MHAIKLTGSLALLFTILLAQGYSVEGATFQSCTQCRIVCNTPTSKGDEARNRFECYANMYDAIKPKANPKGWGSSWTNAGESHFMGEGWNHNRTCSVWGVPATEGKFQAAKRRNGMDATLSCEKCA